MKLNYGRTLPVGFAFLLLPWFGSFATMFSVRHGDSKPMPKISVEAIGGED